jgi:hypothetical protein
MPDASTSTMTYYELNREKIRKQQAEYRKNKQTDKEKQKEYNKRYYESKREEIREKQNQYIEQIGGRDAYKAKQREYYIARCQKAIEA